MNIQVFASNGGATSSFTYITYIIAVAAVFLICYILYAWYINYKVSEKSAEVSVVLNEMSTKDSSWDEEKLLEHVQKVFYSVQADIADKDLVNLNSVSHPLLFNKWKTGLETAPAGDFAFLKSKGILDISIVDSDNYKDNEKDTFTACININSNEYTVDKRGCLVFPNINESQPDKDMLLTEYWKFGKHAGEWKLLDVKRSSHWREAVDNSIINEE